MSLNGMICPSTFICKKLIVIQKGSVVHCSIEATVTLGLGVKLQIYYFSKSSTFNCNGNPIYAYSRKTTAKTQEYCNFF